MSDIELMMHKLFDGEKLTAKQKQILIAAIQLFSEKGYAATSTNEIAKRAGVAEGTIFRHYQTKKDLFMSIVEPFMKKIASSFIVQDFMKLLDQQYDEPEDFLRAVIENRREVIIKVLPIIRIVFQEIPFHPELREYFLELITENVHRHVSVMIKNYQDKGQLIDLPPVAIERFAITSILGFLFSRYVLFPDLEWDDELETDRLVQLIMHGVGKKTRR